MMYRRITKLFSSPIWANGPGFNNSVQYVLIYIYVLIVLHVLILQEYTFEEIRPTSTYLHQSSTLVPAYDIRTHTTTITNTVHDTIAPAGDNEGQVEKMLQNIIPILAPAPTRAKTASTSYTTFTLTKVSTISTEVTSDITITLGGRPVQTEYVRPTTMVSTNWKLKCLAN